MSKMEENKRRIVLLDEIRGVLVILMIAYHFFYTAGYLFSYRFGRMLFRFFSPVEPLFAGLFILLCGLCCHLSRNNKKRGLLLAGIAGGLTVFLAVCMPENVIWFGILHLLAVCILLYTLLQKPCKAVPPTVGLILCVVFTLLFEHFPYDNGFYIGLGPWPILNLPISWTDISWLHFLGIGRLETGDFFPLLPWIFVFFAGVFFGFLFSPKTYPDWTCKSHVPAIAFIGRHALLAYLIHQPVLYGVLWIAQLVS